MGNSRAVVQSFVRFGARVEGLKKAINKNRLKESGRIWSKQAAEAEGLQLVTPAEYAEIEFYSVRKVQKLAQCGKLNAFKQSGKWWIAIPKDA